MRNLLLGAAALLIAAPFLLALSTSLKTLREINSGNLISFPHAPTWVAWIKAWASVCIGEKCRGISPYVVNSFVIVIPSLFLSMCVGALTGFALSLQTSRIADLLFLVLLLGLLIPIQVVLFPMIVALRTLGLFGTVPGVILIHTLWGLPLVTLLFRSSFLGFPKDILCAARIDGAGFLGMLLHVVLPASLPTCGVALILQFTYLWNEFLINLIFAGPGREPVTVALNILAGAQYGVPEYNVNMAAAFLAAAPTIIIYFLSGPLFARGIAVSMIKY